MGVQVEEKGLGKSLGVSREVGEGPVTLRRTLPSGDRVGKQRGTEEPARGGR